MEEISANGQKVMQHIEVRRFYNSNKKCLAMFYFPSASCYQAIAVHQVKFIPLVEGSTLAYVPLQHINKVIILNQRAKKVR